MKSVHCKRFDEYQLVLFDMDGTLYFQRALQFKMARLLLAHALFERNGWRDLCVILQFRRIREKSVRADGIEETLYEDLAKRWRISREQVREIVQKWIYQEPLRYLAGYKDACLLELIKILDKRGVRTAVYSDYPPQEKQKVLGIGEFPGFYGGQKEIEGFKPDPRGILYIMARFGVNNKSRVLMIGDRMSRDGKAAVNAGVDYLIVKKYKLLRTHQYQILCNSLIDFLRT